MRYVRIVGVLVSMCGLFGIVSMGMCVFGLIVR